jgi:hypothetical protein
LELREGGGGRVGNWDVVPGISGVLEMASIVLSRGSPLGHDRWKERKRDEKSDDGDM